MIYVDEAKWKRLNGRKQYAHMTGTNLQELHRFAKLIGVSRSYFHSGNKPHYDITEDQRFLALMFGAITTSSKMILEVARLLSK